MKYYIKEMREEIESLIKNEETKKLELKKGFKKRQRNEKTINCKQQVIR
jgi:hypothetical protein